jgi:hypothetical protein
MVFYLLIYLLMSRRLIMMSPDQKLGSFSKAIEYHTQ